MLEILRRVLVWRWALVLAVLLPSAGLSIAAVESRPETVEAVTVVGLGPDSPENMSDTLIELAVQQYAVVLVATDTLEDVAAAASVDPATVRDGVDVNVTAGSANISISARMADAITAENVATAVANEAISLGKTDRLIDAERLSPATIVSPSLLASPRLLEAVLFLVALAAALAVGYAIEVTRPRIRTGGDAEEATGALVVGSLRTFPKAGKVQRTPKDEDILRAARILRSGFVASGRRLPPGGVTCVIGARPDAGATTVAFLLARSASDSGAAVGLLDADLEDAGLSRNLGLPGASGLDDVLNSRASLPDAVHHEGGVSVVGTRVARDEGDLLQRRLPDVLKEAADTWELSLVDSSPLLGPESSEIVVSHCDSVLLVIPMGSLAEDAARAARRLHRLGVPIRGVVLNHASRAVADAVAAPDVLEDTSHE